MAGRAVNNILALWQAHRDAGWPSFSDSNQGELMTLDTVISGCVTYYLSESGLDPQRVRILEDCLADLGSLLPELDGDAAEYFQRLQNLGRLLLETGTGR
jgi:hypothetical protein